MGGVCSPASLTLKIRSGDRPLIEKIWENGFFHFKNIFSKRYIYQGRNRCFQNSLQYQARHGCSKNTKGPWITCMSY